jgi:hypothetical protein
MFVLQKLLVVISCILITPSMSSARTPNPAKGRKMKLSVDSQRPTERPWRGRLRSESVPEANIISDLLRRADRANPSDSFIFKKRRTLHSDHLCQGMADCGKQTPVMEPGNRPTKSVIEDLSNNDQRHGRVPTKSAEVGAPIAPITLPPVSTQGRGAPRRRVMRMTTPIPSSPPMSLARTDTTDVESESSEIEDNSPRQVTARSSPMDSIYIPAPRKPISSSMEQSMSLARTDTTDVESESSEIDDNSPRQVSGRSSPIDSIFMTPTRQPISKSMGESPISVTDTGISPL